MEHLSILRSRDEGLKLLLNKPGGNDFLLSRVCDKARREIDDESRLVAVRYILHCNSAMINSMKWLLAEEPLKKP